MGLPFGLLAFLLFVSLKGSSAGFQGSAVSFEYCDDFDASNLERYFIIVKERTKDSFGFGWVVNPSHGIEYQLLRLIPQNQIKSISVHTLTRQQQEICFQALVIDTTIFVDMPTVFKASCSEEDAAAVFPKCREFFAELSPSPVCPGRISEVLLNSGVIDTIPPLPGSSSEDWFKPPVYNIIEDMTQASIAIAGGLVQGGKQYIKRYMTGLANAKKTIKLDKIGGTLGSLKSFASAIGPFLGFAGGLTTILTTFLTPNPFDALAEYLEHEFEALHSHLNQMEGELNLVIKGENLKNRMKDTFQAIRFSLREYDEMVKSLAKHSVCGTDQLLENRKVKLFVEEFNRRDTDHHLRDLLTIEEGALPLSGSLLKPIMSMYCKSRPDKVVRFVRCVTSYALLGTHARHAYEQIRCVKVNKEKCDSARDSCLRRSDANQKTCDKEWRACLERRNCEIDMETWTRRLYKLLTRANALETALTTPSEGLYEFFKFDIQNVLSTSSSKMTDASNYFVNNIMFDTENWPKHCILDANDTTVVTAVIKSNAPTDATKLNGTFGPQVETKRSGRSMELIRLKIKHPSSGVDNKKPRNWQTDNGNSISGVTCDVGSVRFSNVYMTCVGRALYVDKYVQIPFTTAVAVPLPTYYRKIYWEPEGKEKDKFVYMELNPDNGFLEIKVQTTDVYYVPYRNRDPRPNYILRLGCWKGNNKKRNYNCDRYFVAVPAVDATPVEFPV